MNPFVKLTTRKLTSILSSYKSRRIFFVHGKNSYSSCGAENLFSLALQSLNCIVYEHFNFSENPKWDEITLAIHEYKEFKPDIVIACGGGSVIDTAKLINFFADGNGTPEKYDNNKIVPTPLYVFPTTAGSGSEATHFAVCYVNGQKYSVSAKSILPSKVFIDYTFTRNNPQYLTACTGLDALCQGIESYWSVNSTIQSRYYAKKAIKYIYPYLTKCVSESNAKYRRLIAKGSYYAGKAINISFTTAPHAFSYGITSKFGIPHGHAVAITLPYFFDLVTKVSKENCIDKRGVSFVKRRIKNLYKYLHLNDLAKEQLTQYINTVLQKEDIQIYFKNKKKEILQSVNIERLKNYPVSIYNEQTLKY